MSAVPSLDTTPNSIERSPTEEEQVAEGSTANISATREIWENTGQEVSAQPATPRLERPDTVKPTWGEAVQCTYSVPEEVCASRSGDHDDYFHWYVSFSGFETYSVGDFAVLNSNDATWPTICKILALWRCSSSRRNYASILRYENAYTVLQDGDTRELLLSKTRQPDKIELRHLKRVVKVLDFAGQPTSTVSLNDYEYYTYRFLNIDGKTVTTVVPDTLIIPKRVPDLPPKIKAKKKRENTLKVAKGHTQIIVEEMQELNEGTDKPKRKRKLSQTKDLSSPQLTTPVILSTSASVIDIVHLISQCEESPEDTAHLIGELPYNKLRNTKKFVQSLLKVLDQMLPAE